VQGEGKNILANFAQREGKSSGNGKKEKEKNKSAAKLTTG
jgi:hypothetical protein